MFKHLLLPTDGTPASNFAVSEGLALALATNASVTGMYVLPSYHWLSIQSDSLEASRGQFDAEVQRRADEILGRLAAAAAKAGVTCDTCVVDHEHVYEGIVAVAETRKCDLIVMASHGRRGVRAILLGSETQKVLTHTRVPVLVLRAPQ